MRTRTGPAWATARRILPSCGTWHSTSCRRMARRKRCAASFSGPDGTMPISPASLLYSEVQLPWLIHRMMIMTGLPRRIVQRFDDLAVPDTCRRRFISLDARQKTALIDSIVRNYYLDRG